MKYKLPMTLSVIACCNLFADTCMDCEDAPTPSEPCVESCTADSTSCFQRGDDPVQSMKCPCPSAYNYPAGTKIEGSCDIDISASYIYWFTKQEGLDLAPSGQIVDSTDFWIPSTQNGHVVFQDTKYTSGFKVGLGFDMDVDDWSVNAGYTYLRQTTHTSAGPATGLPGQNAAFNAAPWFWVFGYQTSTMTQFNSEWKFGLDWIDLMFSRPFYQGQRLVVSPSAGLRSSLIRQQLTVFTPALANSQFDNAFNVTSYNNSNSWGIGPRGVVDARWLVGGGFRFQGNFGGSILFTQYTKVAHTENPNYSNITGTAVMSTRLSNYNCLRPMVEANLGIGWGSYFDQNKYHVDLSATYDFNYLWSQNMMRYLASLNTLVPNSGNPGDLVLHGLEITARFDF